MKLTSWPRLAKERQNRQFLPGITFPDKLDIEADLARAVQQSRDLLLAVPSHAFREVLEKAAPSFNENTRISLGNQGSGAGQRFIYGRYR